MCGGYSFSSVAQLGSKTNIFSVYYLKRKHRHMQISSAEPERDMENVKEGRMYN